MKTISVIFSFFSSRHALFNGIYIFSLIKSLQILFGLSFINWSKTPDMRAFFSVLLSYLINASVNVFKYTKR